jgi:hypothetical protein
MMALLPTRCPTCGGEVETGIAGPRLTFCRSCRQWFTLGGRRLRRTRRSEWWTPSSGR